MGWIISIDGLDSIWGSWSGFIHSTTSLRKEINAITPKLFSNTSTKIVLVWFRTVSQISYPAVPCPFLQIKTYFYLFDSVQVQNHPYPPQACCLGILGHYDVCISNSLVAVFLIFIFFLIIFFLLPESVVMIHSCSAQDFPEGDWLWQKFSCTEW